MVEIKKMHSVERWVLVSKKTGNIFGHTFFLKENAEDYKKDHLVFPEKFRVVLVLVTEIYGDSQGG